MHRVPMLLLAVVLVAAACGGGDATSEDALATVDAGVTTLPTTADSGAETTATEPTTSVPSDGLVEVPLDCLGVFYLDAEVTPVARFSNIEFPREYRVTSIPPGRFESPVIGYKDAWHLDVGALGTEVIRYEVATTLGAETTTEECEIDPAGSPVAEGTVVVTLENGKLTPSNLEIDLSVTRVVRWVNADPPREYVITSREDGLFESPVLAPGDIWEFDFGTLPPALHRYSTMIGGQRIPGYVDTRGEGAGPAGSTGKPDLIDLNALPDAPDPPGGNAVVFDRTVHLDSFVCSEFDLANTLVGFGHDAEGNDYWVALTGGGLRVVGIAGGAEFEVRSTAEAAVSWSGSTVDVTVMLEAPSLASEFLHPAVMHAECDSEVTPGSVTVGTPNGASHDYERAVCVLSETGFTFAGHLEDSRHIGVAGGRIQGEALLGWTTHLFLLQPSEAETVAATGMSFDTLHIGTRSHRDYSSITFGSASAVEPNADGSGLITSSVPADSFTMEALVDPTWLINKLMSDPRVTADQVQELIPLISAEFDGITRVQVECGTVLEGPGGTTVLDLFWGPPPG